MFSWNTFQLISLAAKRSILLYLQTKFVDEENILYEFIEYSVHNTHKYLTYHEWTMAQFAIKIAMIVTLKIQMVCINGASYTSVFELF